MIDYEKTFDWTLDVGLMFLILFTPLAFGSVHVWAYTVMEIVVFTLLAAWALKNFFTKEMNINHELAPLYIAFLLFIAYCFMQTISLSPGTIKALSPKAYDFYSLVIPDYADTDTARSLSMYAYATKVSLLKYMAYFGVFFLITQEIKSERRLRRLILAVMAIGFIEAAYGLYGYFSGNAYILGFKKLYYKETATGTFVNRNHFAGFLGITTFVTLGYLLARVPVARSGGYYSFGQKVFDFLNTARATKGALLLIGVVVMAMGVVFSLSRMGVFSLIAAAFVVFFVTAKGSKKGHAKVILAVVAIGLFAALWYGLDPLEERLYSSTDDLYKNRLVVWKATGQMISDYPLWGSGLGTYENVFQRYKPAGFGTLIIFQHSHNDYLEIIAETGVIGAALAAFSVIYFLHILRRRVSVRNDPSAKGLVLGMTGSLTYIALHSFTDFNMHIPSNALLVFIVMGLAYGVASARRRKRSHAQE